jgi:hypothetical protein
VGLGIAQMEYSMYIAGLIISFKVALLISIFITIAKLRKEAKFARELGSSEPEIKRFYRDNLASSSVAAGQVTLVAGSVLSLFSLAAIWAIS